MNEVVFLFISLFRQIIVKYLFWMYGRSWMTCVRLNKEKRKQCSMYGMLNVRTDFRLNFGGHMHFLSDHWYPCFWLMETSALGCKARVDRLVACFAFSPAFNWFLRFTSGATTADLLVASMATKPFQYMYLQIMYPQELVGVLSFLALSGI